LQRIIDAAAVRYLPEGTSTITTGDVCIALRSTFAQG
jgi:hypothetical protein